MSKLPLAPVLFVSHGAPTFALEPDHLGTRLGVVAEEYAGPGDRVNDNKILKIAQIDPLLVKVVVPADQYGKITVGDAARITVNQAISKKALQAKVWRIDKVMDAASGTFTVWLKMGNAGLRIPAGIRCNVGF